ncbi:hypothetical protein HDU97_009283 [Phlyctochytrium planicorne]|nr:hypothetical protein HDU97_009283 [Phlyctochytrium planicorne]
MKVSVASLISLISLALSATAASLIPSNYDFVYGDADVHVISTSHQEKTIFSTHGFTLMDYNVTVSLAVRNLNPTKVVGIRYTNSSWSDIYEATASYNGNIGNNFELWTLTIQRGAHYTNEVQPEYIVAGWATFNGGSRVWDPRSDYYIYQRATQQTPAIFVDGFQQGVTVNYDSLSKSIFLNGNIRTYTPNRSAFTKPGSISVRWTIDNWKSYKDFNATLTKFDIWNFKIPLTTPDLNLAENVQFAVQYKNGDSSSFWLNNGGQNYVKTLRPKLSYTTLTSTTSFNGVSQIAYYAYCDLTLGGYKARIDGGNYTEFNTQQSPNYFLPTYTFANGNHTVDILVSLPNGPEVFKDTYTITIDNHISFKEQWAPKQPASLPSESYSAWSAAADSGKIYIGYGSGTVARYASFGSTAEPDVVYTVPGAGSYESVYSIVIESGKVYTLSGSRIHKFDEKTGVKDSAFGVNGTINFNPDTVYDGKSVCYPSSMTVVNSTVFVSDSCNYRIVKFTSAGAYVSVLQYPAQQYAYTLSRTATSLISASFVYPTLIISELKPSDFTVLSSTSFDNYSTTDSIAKVDGIYAIVQGSTLVYLKDGKSVAKWTGEGAILQPGNLRIGKSVTDLGDGTLFVVSVEGPALQRFGTKLI